MDFIIKSNTGTKFAIESKLENRSRLAIIFSGIGYTYRNPLLYYSRRVVQELGYDYIGIDFKYYENQEFSNMKDDEQEIMWEEDNSSVIESLMEIEEKYNGIVLIGKSMGTSVIRRYIKKTNKLRDIRLVLITPGNEWSDFKNEIVHLGNDILVVSSLEDKYYMDVDSSELKKKSNFTFIELEKGNHSLETNDTLCDLNKIMVIMDGMRKFINK